MNHPNMLDWVTTLREAATRQSERKWVRSEGAALTNTVGVALGCGMPDSDPAPSSCPTRSCGSGGLVGQAMRSSTPPAALRAAAMSVYTPPFRYERGYIFDSQSHMVADNGDPGSPSVEGAVASRVRGWGRISGMPNSRVLQDGIGQMVADALNALYSASAAAPKSLSECRVGPRSCDPHIEHCGNCAPFLHPAAALQPLNWPEVRP